MRAAKAVARTSEGYEIFGFVSFTEGDSGPADFAGHADFTSELAESNPEWKLDLNDEVIGRWRGEAIRLSERAGSSLASLFEQLGVVTRDEFEELELRVAQL